VLADLFARCSAETVRLRFFGPLRRLPRPYLDELLAGRPDAHDAVLAYPDGLVRPDAPERQGGRPGPVGLGSLSTSGGAPAGADPNRAPGPDAYPYARPDAYADSCPVGELSLLVVDGWQRRGAGSAMLDALFDRARTRGLRLVSASVLPGRQSLLGALGRRLQPVRTTRDIDALTGVYRLDAEQ
jgi:GNAT superfamily N-acetyltransferase